MTRTRKASGHTNGAVAERPPLERHEVETGDPAPKTEIPADLLPTPADIKIPSRVKRAMAAAPDPASNELRLTEEERELIEAYEGHIQTAINAAIGQANIALAPVRQKLAARVQKVEGRLGLPPGSLGKTHGYDTATGIVTAAQG
jgi:hypothetical protein